MGMLHQSLKCHHKILRQFYPARAFIFLILLIILWAGDSPAFGSDQTTAGVVAARSASNASIFVRMPYTGDGNSNNTYTVEYKTCASGSYSPWVANAPHAASPFITTITGLSENTCYDIRATYSDSDGVAGALSQTVRISLPWDNTLIHNINRFGGSTKWNAEGGWGLPGTKYGQFVCETCHVTMAPNIKGIRGSISAPSGTDQFPGQAGGSGVLFQSTIAPNGFGDDTGGHATSQKICEYCHSQTSYHRYNTTGQTRLDHNNNTDCSSCHPHSAGFYFATNACDACHGNPPVADIPGGPNGLASAPPTGSAKAGAHALHATAGGRNYSCDICHYNSVGSGTTHRDASISIGFVNILGPGTYTGGAYDGQSSANYLATDTGTSVTKTGAKTCSSLYCHGSTMAPNNGTNITPTWDLSTTAACGTCHGATTAKPPTRGTHSRHAGPSTDIGHDYPCDICHSGLVPSSIPSGMLTHVNNKSEIRFSSDPKVSGGTYTGTDAMLDAYGNCSNVYCHSSVQSSPPGEPIVYVTTPDWGNNNTLIYRCDACHEGPAEHETGAPLTGNSTGSHAKHALKNVYCAACHANDPTQPPDPSIDGWGCLACHTATGPHSTHANYSIDVNMANLYGGTYSGSPAPGDDYGSCSNVNCHSNGLGVFRTVFWGTTNTSGCGFCHDALPTSGSHAKHVLTAATIYGSLTNSSTTDAHDFGCGECHPVNAIKHANGALDITLNKTHGGILKSKNNVSNDTGGYTRTSGSSVICSAAYCHSDGKGTFAMTPEWYGGTFPGDACAACHLNSPATAAHEKHVVGIHYYNIYNGTTGLAGAGSTALSSHGNAGTSTTINCNICHNLTVTTPANDKNTLCAACHNGSTAPLKGNATIASRVYHVNGTADIGFNEAILVKSRAQVRDSITTVPELNANWSRTAGSYKAGATPNDTAKNALNTAAGWASSDKGCSNIACHNGYRVKWTDTVTCGSCHRDLP